MSQFEIKSGPNHEGVFITVSLLNIMLILDAQLQCFLFHRLLIYSRSFSSYTQLLLRATSDFEQVAL